MIQAPETVGDVTLDEPCCPRPFIRHLAERGVAATTGAETVLAVRESRFIISLQEEADHFTDEFVRPWRHAERPSGPVFLRDIDPVRAENLVRGSGQQGCSSVLRP